MEASCRRVRWRRGAQEARGGFSDVEVRSSGDLEARCRRADVEAWRYGALEFLGGRSEPGDVEVLSSGVLETLSACRGVDVRGMERLRHAAGVAPLWYGGMECWSRDVGASMWRHGDMEPGGALQSRCRRVDEEVWRCGALKL